MFYLFIIYHFLQAVPFVLTTIDEGFLPPRKLQITGTPRMNATRFEINLMVGQEYLFHLRIDPPARDVPQVNFKNWINGYNHLFKGFIVRNSTKNGEWQEEEREIPFFPFKVISSKNLLHILNFICYTIVETDFLIQLTHIF